MKVSEFIKNKNNFIITKDGKILAIKNEGSNLTFGYNNDDEVLNSEVKKIQIIEGIIKNITCIRL